MHEDNGSYVFLMGFQNLHRFNICFFLFLVIIYCVSIGGNVLIITLVAKEKNLHSPMYFFITQVSLLDIITTTDIVPNLLHIVLQDGGSMSLAACISQFNVFAHSISTECFILTVMSYDRYLAICNPLRYNAIINKTFCVRSVIASWMLSFIMMIMDGIYLYQLDFCRPNVIDHFFCDLPLILELACSDISLFQIQIVLFGMVVITIPFVIIIVSYAYIISAILKICTITGRQKAFSTCSSHLTVVCIFFGTLFSVYMVPAKGHLLSTSKVLSLLYTAVTPLINPFLYSLRNKDFKEAFGKFKQSLNIS